MDLRTAGRVLPDLRIVPAAQVFLHEDADPVRVERLSVRLRQDGALRNPPIAAGLPGDAFVVLDGANRTSALTRLEAPVIPLQVVDYDDPAVRLDVWRHLIVERLDVPGALRATGVPLERSTRDAAGAALRGREIACYVMTGSQTYVVRLLPDRPLAALLAQIVATYRGSARIYRVATEDFDALVREYGEVSAVVVFPRLEKQDILTIANSAARLPTGITRHLIPGRALRVNVPLELLSGPGDAARKHERLQDLIRQRLLDNSVRYYPEGAFLFDE